MYEWDTIWQGVSGVLQVRPMTIMLVAIVVSSIFAALPGVGSSTLLAMSMPLAMTLPPYECIALMFGITIISNTANTFPSVLIAVPGGSGSQATMTTCIAIPAIRPFCCSRANAPCISPTPPPRSSSRGWWP